MNIDQTPSKLETVRHSFAHVLAQAVLRLFPDAKMGIGPAIEDGFYYDFEFSEAISKETLPQIEAEMKNIIAEELSFKQILIPREQAFDTLLHLGQIYKTELLQQVPDESISFYKTGEEFIDLCRGPHVNDTGQLKIFKLVSIQSTHWLGDESRPAMQRIRGVAFEKKNELEAWLKSEEEKKLRDHRVLGKSLNIFYDDKIQGHGMPVLLHNGTILKKNLRTWFENMLIKNDYQLITSSEFIKETTLHTNRYLDYNRFAFLPQFQVGSDLYRLRIDPISQIGNIFRQKKRSYKELPLRISEFASCYSNVDEKELHGLIKCRHFTRDSHTSFVSKEQTIPEVRRIISLMVDVVKRFDLHDYRFVIGTPKYSATDNYLGNEQDWRDAMYIIEKSLSESKILARPQEGEAQFNGPTLQIRARDIFKRDWKIAELVVDLTTQKISNNRFINSENEEEIPIAIHHSFIGSLERFIGILIEQYAGAFPAWMAPTQVYIIPISSKHLSYSKQVLERLETLGIRAKLDARDETMQAKIREAGLQKIPYMLIIGDKEEKTQSVSVRPRSGQDLGLMRTEEFADIVFSER
ncbi:MAG: threonine--tRNA ligase [Candidatus Dojkabacteria bacterium]|nr:MAG: threonine--tRNA ligase [Candidatus Dojkabacteria bacterium]